MFHFMQQTQEGGEGGPCSCWALSAQLQGWAGTLELPEPLQGWEMSAATPGTIRAAGSEEISVYQSSGYHPALPRGAEGMLTHQ